MFKKLPPILRNAFFWTTIIFLIWMAFFARYNFLYQKKINKEYKKAKQEKEFYINEIKKDSAEAAMLEDTIEMERYAREKYFMKKENEDIFIIEEIDK